MNAEQEQAQAQPRSRRLATIVWGAIPLAVLAAALSLDHIPGTDISLTVPYAAQGPGPMFNTLGEVEGVPVVEIEGADSDATEGNLNMTTVSVRTNMTLVQALTRWITTDDTIVPLEQIMPPNTNHEEMKQRNQEAFVASESAATIAAMNYLGRPTTVVVHEVMEDSAANGVLQAADIIQRVGGKDVSQPREVQRLVREHAPGDRLTVDVLRDGAPHTEEITLGANPEDAKVPMLGILMTSAPADGVQVTYNLNDVGGPSAGMVFSLAVIDKLSPGLLNGGKFVAGTGTIDESGEVGPIGGISHKIAGARDAGAELFLAPEGNCADVMRTDSGDMQVAAVKTLDDAVKAMDAFAHGQPVRSCS